MVEKREEDRRQKTKREKQARKDERDRHARQNDGNNERRNTSGGTSSGGRGSRSSNRTNSRSSGTGNSSRGGGERRANPTASRNGSHYDVLGVSRCSNSNQIVKAHKNLMLIFHPDKVRRNGTEAEVAEAEKIMAQINVARDILLNVNDRAKYDRTL